MPPPDKTVRIQLQDLKADPRALYARRILSQGLANLGYRVDESGVDTTQILLSSGSTDLAAEGFELECGDGATTVRATDGSGLIYGSHRVLELVGSGANPAGLPAIREEPKLSFRAIKFDLPWDTYRHATALWLHQETCADLAYWESFLDMLASNRFNVLTLWNLHPYPFLIRLDKFPEASPWTDEEFARWQSLFHGIFQLAHERGIDTYLMPFNIFVPPEFAKNHGVALNNLEHHHFVDADRAPVIKEYTRACVTTVLNEYPLLSGIGLTLGEGMGGMTPVEREDWVHETIVEGMRRANRSSKLIHRIPFSGGTKGAGATTVEMEQVTRAGIEGEAALQFIEKPVWAGLKFNWSHPLSTTKLVKVHGGRLFGTYFDPVPADYKVFWTVRNEDILCLRWGAPEFLRQHIAENSREYVGGYMVGSETYIPAHDYFTNPGLEVPWAYAFERQWLYYLLWGRLLYDRDTPEEVFTDAFVRRYGAAGEKLYEAVSLASLAPVRLNFSYDTTWDFTLYAEGFLARMEEGPRVEFISVDRLIEHLPLDSSYIRIADFVGAERDVEEHVSRRPAPSHSTSHRPSVEPAPPDARVVTPLEMAGELETNSNRALELVKDIDVAGDIALFFEVADVQAWCRYGLYFAAKLRGAVELERFRVTGDREAGDRSVAFLEDARKEWDELVAITRPIYQDMPLVHLSEQNGKPSAENDHLRFHWEHLRPAVVRDVEIARAALRDRT